MMVNHSCVTGVVTVTQNNGSLAFFLAGAPNGDDLTDIGEAYDAVLRMSSRKHGYSMTTMDRMTHMLKALLNDVLSVSLANNCVVAWDVSRFQAHTVPLLL